MGAGAQGVADAHHIAADARRRGFSRIVLAYDGSISSRQGLTWIPHLLAGTPGARAIILHVHDPAAKPRSALARQLGLSDLDELVRSLDRGGIDARPLVVGGDPAREIPRAVMQLHADLLICGSRGRGPFGRKVMGTVAADLVKHTDANLLVARTGAPPAHVLLATDGSVESVHACRLGTQLVHRWSAEATLLGVSAAGSRFPPELAVDILPKEHDAFEVATRDGDPAEAIMAATVEKKAGLVILGRRGQGRRPDALVGRTAARVARDAVASVLLVRRTPEV